MTGAEWADIIGAGNDAFLRTYSTITQKPVATVYPTSVMGALGGPIAERSGMGALGGSALIVVLAVVVGAVLILKK